VSNHIEEFRAAMRVNGLDYSGPIHQDGKRYRVKCDEDKSADTWYILYHPDPIAAGAFGCWKRNIKQTWRQNGKSNISPEEFSALKKKWSDDQRSAEIEQEQLYERAAAKAEVEFKSFSKVKEHDYLNTKQVPALGDLRENPEGELVVPLRDSKGKLWSYQTIDCFGDKLFLQSGRVQGCFFTIGNLDDGPIVVCEGYATGATIHQATSFPVICAMNCGNLKKVVVDLRADNPDRTFVIAADNDRFTKKQDGSLYNVGVEKAREAANIIKATVCIPEFPAGSSSGTDFNDLSQQCGEGVVRGQFHALLGIGMGKRITIRDLLTFVPDEDKDSMLGKRFLCTGGSCVIVGQTSAGKSSLGMQMAIMWALGQDFFGLKPRRPLRSLYIQAENDTGDTAEMFQGILMGLGLVDEKNPEQNNAIIRVLEKNLIIVRDQTHIGPSFPGYARKLVEIHKPDLFWLDPLLSFFGDDINDQKAMSLFLRSQLNPISEETGIIWMLLHHTGKPQRDAAKSQKSWSSRDFAYMGLGSSELSNWARAIITVVNSGEDEFRVVFAKRGWRAGTVDDHGNPCTELNLAHSGDYICWKRIQKPKDGDEMADIFAAFAKTITTPMSATRIVKQAANELQRGERTMWSAWGAGEGELGKHFHRDGILWVGITSQKSPKPYADD
jgi:phage/plasmid primase-like uncharacterized protein